jgi:transposase
VPWLIERVLPVRGPRSAVRDVGPTTSPPTAATTTTSTVCQRGIGSEIARRRTGHGSGLGRARWIVERTFAWLHHFKRLRVRYDRRHEIHEAFLAIGCCLICFRRLPRSLNR